MSRRASCNTTSMASGCWLAVQYCSVFERVSSFFLSTRSYRPATLYIQQTACKKRPRGSRRRSKSGRKRPGWAATAELSLVPLIPDDKVPCIDDSQFWARFSFAWMTRRRMRLPITSAEHFLLLGVQVSLALFQHECSHNPDRLPNKAISCHLRARHARIFPSGEPAPAGCVGSLSWRVPMCGRHQQLNATEHTFSFLETA
jgi:hypothetical protein